MLPKKYKWKSQPTINRVKNSRDATYKLSGKENERVSSQKMTEIGGENDMKENNKVKWHREEQNGDNKHNVVCVYVSQSE